MNYLKRKWAKESFPSEKGNLSPKWILKLHFVDFLSPLFILQSFDFAPRSEHKWEKVSRHFSNNYKKSNWQSHWFDFWKMLRAEILWINKTSSYCYFTAYWKWNAINRWFTYFIVGIYICLISAVCQQKMSYFIRLNDLKCSHAFQPIPNMVCSMSFNRLVGILWQ